MLDAVHQGDIAVILAASFRRASVPGQPDLAVQSANVRYWGIADIALTADLSPCPLMALGLQREGAVSPLVWQSILRPRERMRRLAPYYLAEKLT